MLRNEHRSDEDDDVRDHLRAGCEDAGSGAEDLAARTRRRFADDTNDGGGDDAGDDVAGHVAHLLDPKR